MSSVDITAIEEAMRMANLDTLRGYNQGRYGEVHQDATTEYISQTQALGYQVLNEPMWNKGESACLSLAGSPPTPLRPIFILNKKHPPGPSRFLETNVTASLCSESWNVILSSGTHISSSYLPTCPYHLPPPSTPLPLSHH
jgi:hypothetical protein